MKRKNFKFYGLLALALVFVASCTDLEIDESDSIISTDAGGGFNGVEDVTAAIDNLYNGMNRLGDQANFYALQEVATDEQLVPTRGTDWGDNGIWRTLHAHTWGPGHQYILNTWNNWNQTIFLASEVIDSRSNPTAEEEAQARFVRAFATWVIMDMFGQAPFREVDAAPQDVPTVRSRAEAYADVIADIDFAIANLPSVAGGDVANQNRGTVAAAQFLKARVLLNSGVYLGTGTADSAALNEVVSLVDAIEADGYALQAGYFEIFEESADSETIFWLPTSVGNRIWNGAHYNTVAPDNTGGGWNGFSTLAEFYDMFEGPATDNSLGAGQEERRGWVPDATNADETNLGFAYGFFIGQAYDANANPLSTRPGPPLVFTRDFPGLIGNGEATGIRVIKYHPVNGSFTNHELIFRFADAHLMRAEAYLRGAGGGDATSEVNELRVLRGATPLGAVTDSELLDERGRELYVEAIRRTDMVRFGQFTRAWEFKEPASVGDVNKNLYPIPTNALLSNPNLVQNEGY